MIVFSWPLMLLVCFTVGGGVASVALAQRTAPEEPHSVKAPLAAHSLLLDGVKVAGRMAAVGERGHSFISEDQGEAWRQTEVPTRATLTGVFFHDANLGWAVGHDAIILRTRDGGESWERVYYAPEQQRPLLDVWFNDAENGFAIGAYGFLLRTADGGETWSPQQIGFGVGGCAVVRLTASRGDCCVDAAPGGGSGILPDSTSGDGETETLVLDA